MKSIDHPILLQTFQLRYKKKILATGLQSHTHAIQARNAYANLIGVSPEVFTIVANKTVHKADKQLADKLRSIGKNKSIANSRIISGQTLRHKTISDSSDLRYHPEKYEHNGQVNLTSETITFDRVQTLVSKQTGERIKRRKVSRIKSVDNCKGVYYFRSMERNKGLSTIFKNRGSHKPKRSDIHDFATFHKVMEVTNNYELPQSRVEVVRKLSDKFTTITEFRKHVQTMYGISCKQAKALIKQATM